MNPATFNRLHELRMENAAAQFAQAEMRPRFNRIAGRHENGTAPRAVSAFNLFQTPPELAARLVALLGPLPPGARILEPSAGLGRILDALRWGEATDEPGAVRWGEATDEPGAVRWGEATDEPGPVRGDAHPTTFQAVTVAVEIAAACAGELYRQNRPGVRIVQRDFLTCTPADLLPAGATGFDAIAMNPPFHLRSDIRHILHARQFLKPGGKLAALCLDTPHRETALRPLACHWEKIPANTFKQEGTRVACILALFKP